MHGHFDSAVAEPRRHAVTDQIVPVMRATVDEAGQRFLACLHRRRTHRRFDGRPLRTVVLGARSKMRGMGRRFDQLTNVLGDADQPTC